jgi:aminobenzoyl-glutamate transport protein
MLFIYFFIVGIVYGMASGTIQRGKDIPRMMEKGMVGVAGFLVVCLPAAVFIDLFHKSQMTSIIAVSGANLIRNLQVGHIPTILTFAVVCASLNLFITSGFTKWLLLAPIFIPMFYQLGISPAITQMAYRIGDATTDIISPVSAYLPFLLGLLEKYRNKDQRIGIGSAISLMLPYSLFLLILWILFLALWLVLGLNPGPGVSLFVGR